MSRAWLSFAPDEERITVWLGDRRPQPDALRMDARVLDRHGAPAIVSLVLAPAGVRLKFDDLAVQQARRRVLAGPYPDAVTTLLSDDSHFEGALSVIRGGDYDDPFARVFPARLLRVEPVRPCAAAGRTDDRALRLRPAVAVGSLQRAVRPPSTVHNAPVT
jgi:hypothetical protein